MRLDLGYRVLLRSSFPFLLDFELDRERSLSSQFEDEIVRRPRRELVMNAESMLRAVREVSSGESPDILFEFDRIDEAGGRSRGVERVGNSGYLVDVVTWLGGEEGEGSSRLDGLKGVRSRVRRVAILRKSVGRLERGFACSRGNE